VDQALRAIQTGVRLCKQDERSLNKRLSVLHGDKAEELQSFNLTDEDAKTIRR